MKRFGWLFILIIVLHLGITFFTHRTILTTPFDAPYWQERFDQSQWRLPISQRVIGDDGLYLYGGWALVHGADPTSFNAEMPPLAKYLIGLTTLWLGNGHLYAFLVNGLVLIAFFFLAKALLKDKWLALGTTAVLALDPLLTRQFFSTMVDTTQLFFLLLFFLFLTRLAPQNSQKTYLLSGLAGLALGFFSVSKLPIFSPILALIPIIFFLKRKEYFQIIVFLGATFLAILSVYWRYFFLGHGLIDWLKVQKWIVAFYLKSNLSPNQGSALGTLLLNRYQNLFTQNWETIKQWSPTWPLITILGLIGLVKTNLLSYKKKAFFVWAAISLFVFFHLIVNNLIPFWARYLILILPFLYLGSIAWFKKFKKRKVVLVFLLILLALNWSASLRLYFPTPQEEFDQLLHNWRHGFFADLYQQTAQATKQNQSRQEFDQRGQKFYYDAEVEAVEIEGQEKGWSRWHSPQTVKVKVIYFTRQLGSFSEEKEITIIKEKDQWRIPWEWDWLMSDLDENNSLETKVSEARRGAILHPDQIPLAHDAPGFLVWITSSEVDPTQEQVMLKFLENLFKEKPVAVSIHHRYISSGQPNQPIPIGVLPKTIDPQNKEKLEEFPGIKLTTKMTRAYQPDPAYDIGEVINSQYSECCSWLYSTTSYDGKFGIEKEENEILKGYNGGQLIIKNESGEIVRQIINLEKKDGQNVQL